MFCININKNNFTVFWQITSHGSWSRSLCSVQTNRASEQQGGGDQGELVAEEGEGDHHHRCGEGEGNHQVSNQLVDVLILPIEC